VRFCGRKHEALSTFLHGEITKEILGAAFAVQKEFGYGFLEIVSLSN
jgi:hypothetical protein